MPPVEVRRIEMCLVLQLNSHSVKWRTAMNAGRRVTSVVATLMAAVVIVGSFATSAPASASGREAPQQAAATAECYENDTFEGYTGKFKCGTDRLRCSWDGDLVWDEAFGVAPDRTIWHAWENSGGWKQMPNNGKADNVHNCYLNGNHQRQVEVWVNGSGVWYTYYSGGWRGWYKY